MREATSSALLISSGPSLGVVICSFSVNSISCWLYLMTLGSLSTGLAFKFTFTAQVGTGWLSFTSSFATGFGRLATSSFRTEQMTCIWHSLLLLIANLEQRLSLRSTTDSPPCLLSVCTETSSECCRRDSCLEEASHAGGSSMLRASELSASISAAKFSSEGLRCVFQRREVSIQRLTLLDLSSSLICKLFSSISWCKFLISFNSDSQDSFSSSIAFSSWITNSDGHVPCPHSPLLEKCCAGVEETGLRWWSGVTQTTCDLIVPRSNHLLLMQILGGETTRVGEVARRTGWAGQNCEVFLKCGSGGGRTTIFVVAVAGRRWEWWEWWQMADCDCFSDDLPPSSMVDEFLLQKLGEVAEWGGWFSFGCG